MSKPLSLRIPAASNRRLLGWLGFAVLFLAVWYPSLDVGFRNDHWWFLREIRDFPNELWSLIKSTYSYPRTRTVLPVGYHEFRPLTHAIMAADQYFFGTNGKLWMVHSLAVHLFSSLAMFWLLRPYCSFWLSLTAVACFSLGVGSLELVTWSHMHGYNWFILFVVLAFGYFDRGQRLRTSLALTLSCLSVELGVFACLVLLATAILGSKKSQWRGWLLPLIFPIATFFFLDLIDYVQHFGWSFPPSDGPTGSGGLNQLLNSTFTATQMMFNYSILIVMPWFLRVDLSKWPFHTTYEYGLFHSRPVLFDQVFLAFMGFAFLFWVGRLMVRKNLHRRNENQRDLGIALVICAMAFIFVVALLRNDSEYLLHQRLHYSYLWTALFIPGAIFLISPFFRASHLRACLALGMIVLLQGGTTFVLCLKYRSQARPLVEYYRAIQEFVDQPQLGEVQLVLPNPKDVPDLELINYTLARREGKIVLVEPFTLSSLVFHRYLAPKPVKYQVDVTASGIPKFTLQR